MINLNMWLGPRRSAAEKELDRVVWHQPPALPIRLGDMTTAQLKAVVGEVHRCITHGGSIELSKDDPHKRIFFKHHI